MDNVCAAVNECPEERKSKRYENMWLAHACIFWPLQLLLQPSVHGSCT